MKLPTQNINVLIADDHQIFIDGLKMIFSELEGYHVVAQAQNGAQALDYLSKYKIDIAILDVNMPKPNGFELCTHITQYYPNCKSIILSMYNDEQFATEFIKLGAKAYILKSSGKSELLNALKHIAEGNIYISNLFNTNSTVTQAKDDFSKLHGLTKREIEIIKLLATEKSSQQIADELFLSVYTINTHRKNILQKLGIKNVAGIIRFASEQKLL
jgi:DNA-binding NarL/FixJ family response regulator